MGVPAHLVKAKGYGDSKNLVPNTSQEARNKNKRVEAKIL
jgi:outer membrane protein OmpA-like peptidoglycan-associated protein